MIRLEPKRADEERTHRHNWAAFLGEDTIASQTTTGTGVTVDSSTIEDGTAIRFKLSGGANGTTATVKQSIVTANGEEETELFTILIGEDVAVSLAQAKEYLRVRHDDEDDKIASMIPRAQAWVEDHTGLALTQRSITERHWPKYGAVRLFKGPLVTVDEVAYGDAETYVPRYWPGQSTIFPATDSSWPTLGADDKFAVTYTAGFGPGEVDERLIGAVLALIEGEYAEGYAYPERATAAAERCCAYLRSPVI